MTEDEHIPAERMEEVVRYCNAFLKEIEQAHMGLCPDCLHAFAALVLDERDYIRRRIWEIE